MSKARAGFPKESIPVITMLLHVGDQSPHDLISSEKPHMVVRALASQHEFWRRHLKPSKSQNSDCR